MYLCEGEMYWENNLKKILNGKKKLGSGGEASRKFLQATPFRLLKNIENTSTDSYY